MPDDDVPEEGPDELIQDIRRGSPRPEPQPEMPEIPLEPIQRRETVLPERHGLVQNPQPAVFSEIVNVEGGTSSPLIEVVHVMGAPENLKIYEVRAFIVPEGISIIGGGIELSIVVGSNMVPSRPINLSSLENGTIVFPTPIFVEWSQRLYIHILNREATNRRVFVTLIGEITGENELRRRMERQSR